MIRRLAIALVGAVVVGTVASAIIPLRSEAQDERPGGMFFDDNQTTHEPNIEAIARAAITGGCVVEGTAFCPDLPVTRAQMASFLARALELEPSPAQFSDVDPASVHAQNVGAIADAQITLGCGPSVFCPSDFVTREQMASFLARGLDLPPSSTSPFTDVTGTHLANVKAIAAAGITLGCNADGTLFCPELEVIRGQMASFLARGLGLDPVDLPTPIHLIGLNGMCDGATPLCATTASIGSDDRYYILEGWFYSLPYAGDDASTFLAEDTLVIVTIDGEDVGQLPRLPTTDLFGTMVRLQGIILDDLEPGSHLVLATWIWGGQPQYTAEVTINLGG